MSELGNSVTLSVLSQDDDDPINFAGQVNHNSIPCLVKHFV